MTLTNAGASGCSGKKEGMILLKAAAMLEVAKVLANEDSMKEEVERERPEVTIFRDAQASIIRMVSKEPDPGQVTSSSKEGRS